MRGAVEGLLLRHRRAIRWRRGAGELLWGAGWLPWVAAGAIGLAAWAPVAGRIWVLLWVVTGVARVAGALRTPSLADLARRLERDDRSLEGLLSAAREIEAGERSGEGESAALREELLRRAADLSGRWRPARPPVDLHGPCRRGLAGMLGLGLVALGWPHAFLALPGRLGGGVEESTRWLRVEADPARLIEGESTRLRALALAAAPPDTVELGIREVGGSWRWRPLARGERNIFGCALPALRRDIEVTARAAGFVADTARVRVRERPRVRQLEVAGIPPAYTELPEERSSGDLVLPRGSRVRIEGRANVALAGARVHFDGGDSTLCDVEGERFSGAWRASADTTWRVALADSLGTPPAVAARHRIRVVPDHEPVVELLMPATDVDLDETMLVGLRWRALDDYGLGAVELAYRTDLEGEPAGRVTLSEGELGERAEGDFVWSLDALDLLPGDCVELWIRGCDNDAIGGPKWAESERRRARFPSIVEIYAEVAGHAEEGSGSARRLGEAFEEMGETLRALREAAADEGGRLSWDARRELEDLRRRGDELRDAIEAMERDLEREARGRSLNMALAVVEKLDEVHRLIDEVLDEELRRLLEELGQALEAAGAEELDRSLARAEIHDREILRGLERTAAILERLRQEQALEQGIAMAAELAERESRVGEMIDEGAVEAAAAAQREVPRQMEALREQVAESTRSGLDEDLARSLERAAEAALGPVSSDLAERVARDLDAARGASARSGVATLRGGFEALHARMMELQELHMTRVKGAVEASLEAAISNLLELSRRTERAARETTSDPTGAALRQARLSRAVRAAMDRIEELERTSLFVTPDVRGRLSLAADALDGASRAIAEAREEQGRRQGKAAMAHLNRAAAELLEGLAALQGAASSTGYPEAMAQLAEAARAQAQLLGEGRAMLPIPGPGGGPEQRAALARMADEQARIRELVAQAGRALGDRGGGIGDLRALEEQMEEVEQALRQGASPASIERQQETILSRLLDSERALRKQGESERREARAAGSYAWAPDTTAATVRPDSTRRVGRAAIIRALDERYPASYEELIRAYFEALARRGGRP